MTERYKEKLMMFMLVKRMAKDDIEALRFIKYTKENMNYEKVDRLYKEACKRYRKEIKQ